MRGHGFRAHDARAGSGESAEQRTERRVQHVGGKAFDERMCGEAPSPAWRQPPERHFKTRTKPTTSRLETRCVGLQRTVSSFTTGEQRGAGRKLRFRPASLIACSAAVNSTDFIELDGLLREHRAGAAPVSHGFH